MKPVIQAGASGVLSYGNPMNAIAANCTEAVISREAPHEQTLEVHLEEYATLAFRVALSVLRERAAAEDAAQEALLRACKSSRKLRDPARFKGWLVRIAWRVALDDQRAARRRGNHEEAGRELHFEPTEAASAEAIAAGREFERRVAAELQRLPEKLRLVMTLGAIEGYDTKEMAQMLGLPQATVKSRLRLARKRLAEKLR